jgi:predicted ester cyclase
MRLGIADCLCRDNQVVEEWVLGDEAGFWRRLGLDPIAYGRELGTTAPEAYTIGNDAMRQRWADANGLTIEGDAAIANRIIETYSAMWNDKNLNVMGERYDRAVRLEGPDAHLSYGLPRATTLFLDILSSIPDGHFEPHHMIVRREPNRPVRAALRWSYCGTHSGYGRYGPPVAAPLALLGISHFELRDGRIVNEWLVVDETAVYAQIAAYQLA